MGKKEKKEIQSSATQKCGAQFYTIYAMMLKKQKTKYKNHCTICSYDTIQVWQSKCYVTQRNIFTAQGMPWVPIKLTEEEKKLK